MAAGKGGKKSPQRRLSDREVARRREAVTELWEAGYRRDKIAEALRVGQGTVSRDVRVLGLLKGPKRYRDRAGNPPAIPWRDTDPEPQPSKRRKPKVKKTTTPPVPAPEPQPLSRQSTTIATIAAPTHNPL